MLKTELVSAIKSTTGLNQRQSSEVVDSFIEQITNALARGERVNLIGFGSFSIKHAKARQGRNPQTGEPLLIKAHNVPVFKAGSQFKQLTNGEHND